MNWETIRNLESEGWITVQKNPETDLWILNYTQKCQFSGHWTEETMQCRGLIVDKDGKIKARPFKKFFNLEQHATLEGLPELQWDKPYLIHEKMDGSLGILYWMGEYGKSEPRIATRGSFTSEQAIKATEMLRKKQYPYTQMFLEGYTYLFEIIYPENRIVVNYEHPKERLTLLAMVNTETGEELEIYGPDFNPYFATPKDYPPTTPKDQLRELVPNDGSTEGLVIRFEDGTRVKVKTEEYVRLHRLLTEVSSKSIWDLLKNGTPLDEIIESVPDEFYDWVKSVKEDLESQWEEKMMEAHRQWDLLKYQPRKEAAEILMQGDKVIAAATFALLDGNKEKASQTIWKSLKPAYERPFKKDIDL